MARQVFSVSERSDVVLDRIAAYSGRLGRLGDRYATALVGQLQNPGGQLWQAAEKDDLVLNLLLQGPLLLLQRA
jgi:hypothetical protein